MSFELAIVCMWTIASMLACWCFSLIVRLVAEWIARKRRRLAGRYTKKSLVLAFLLIGVCAIGALVSAGSAYLLTSTAGVGISVTPIGAIGMGVLLFACFLAIWASVGDRSRGRLRCPRCWYDMRDSKGMPCPECGHEIKNERQLLRTRRPRWAFMLAAVFVAVGLGGVLMNQRYSNQGLVGFIPDSLLLAMRDRIPASWIYDTGGNYSGGSLRARMVSGKIGTETRHRLVNEILDEMLHSRDSRWDPRTLNLLDGALYRELFGQDPDAAEPVWVPSDRRLERVYAAALGDLAKMLAIGPQDAIDDAMLNKFNQDYPDLLETVRRWLLSHEFGRPETYYSFNMTWNQLLPRYAGRIDHYVSSQPPPINAIDEIGIFSNGGDFVMQGRLQQLLTDTGGMPERVMPYLDAVESSETVFSDPFFATLGAGLASLPMDQQAAVYTRLAGWLRSDNLRLRLGAIKVMDQCERALYLPGSFQPPEFDQLIEIAIDRCIDDQRLVPEDRWHRTVSEYLGMVIVRIDPSGVYAFPYMRHDLKLGSEKGAGAYYDERWFSWDDACIAQWLGVFEALTADPDPFVREWVARHIPKRVGTPYDERLDAMLERLATDDDSTVRDSANTSRSERQSNKSITRP